MKKEQMEIPGSDTELSRAADDLVELYDECRCLDKKRKAAKESCENAKERVAGIMVSLGKDVIHHGGLKIVAQVPKESHPTVKIKEEN